MIFAIASWLMSLIVFTYAIQYCLRRRMLAGASSLSYLALLVCVRPTFFFLGLDAPVPDDEFSSYFWDDASLASLSALVWVSVFMLAYLAARPLAPVFGAVIPSVKLRPTRSRMRIIAAMAVAVAVIGNGMLVLTQDSIAQFLWAAKFEKEFVGMYAIQLSAAVAGFVCIFGLINSTTRLGDAGRRATSFHRGEFRYYVVLLTFCMAANFVWGGRMRIVLLLAVMLISYHSFVRAVSLRELISIAIVILVAMLALRYVRELLASQIAGSQVQALSSVSFVRGMSASLHLSEFDALMLALRDAGHVFPFRNGEDFYTGLLSWIPRQFIDRAYSFHIGPWFRQIYEPGRINGWPVTVIGSWWVNFGVLGIVVGALLSGLLLRAVDWKLRHARTNPWHAVFAPVFGLFLFSNGGVDTGFPQNIFSALLPVGLLGLAVRVRLSQRRAVRTHWGSPVKQ